MTIDELESPREELWRLCKVFIAICTLSVVTGFLTFILWDCWRSTPWLQ